MFRVFGHENVWVLDGGMPKWRDLTFDVESSASNDAIVKASLAHEAIEKVYKGELVSILLLHNQICSTNLLILIVHFCVARYCQISYIWPQSLFSFASLSFSGSAFYISDKIAAPSCLDT